MYYSMGCDYYIIVELVVTYQKNDKIKTKYLEYNRLRMYHYFSYDKDVDNYNKLAKAEMEFEEEQYKKQDKTLYENKSWLIQKDDVIAEYIEFLAQNKISFDQVIKIEKRHMCQER